jgi:polar amino acid transport system substrate-binding protein
MGKQVGGTAIAGDKNNCPSGKDIKVSSFDKQTDANSALLSSRADILWVDQPVADYQVKQSGGKMKLGGKPCSVAPYGIALPKGSPLEKPITDALKYLMDNNGYYTNVLKTWGVEDGAVQSSDVTLNNNSSVGDSCVPSY